MTIYQFFASEFFLECTENNNKNKKHIFLKRNLKHEPNLNKPGTSECLKVTVRPVVLLGLYVGGALVGVCNLGKG
jgi:hypothetical protein